MPASSLSFADIPSDPWVIDPRLMPPPVGVNAWMPGVAANLMKNADSSSLNPSVEFHIQSEDFPALPGANTAHRDSNSLPSQPSMVSDESVLLTYSSMGPLICQQSPTDD